MLVTEMFNATTKALYDFVEPAKNEKVGIIKDIVSAAAGISILIWPIVFAVEAVRVFQVWR
jgi:diacylglycerol kinase